jgi:mono/diheme cytochrome c family protein
VTKRSARRQLREPAPRRCGPRLRARPGADDFDAAGTYKTKCIACHGAKAEKKFDATLSDDALVQAVLKGKKAEKPPNMPAFEGKGIGADEATALVAYMKSIK